MLKIRLLVDGEMGRTGCTGGALAACRRMTEVYVCLFRCMRREHCGARDQWMGPLLGYESGPGCN